MEETTYEEWLEAELMWAYRYIIGDTEDSWDQTQAGWRSFNGIKKISRTRDFKKWNNNE